MKQMKFSLFPFYPSSLFIFLPSSSLHLFHHPPPNYIGSLSVPSFPLFMPACFLLSSPILRLCLPPPLSYILTIYFYRSVFSSFYSFVIIICLTNKFNTRGCTDPLPHAVNHVINVSRFGSARLLTNRAQQPAE